MSEKIMPKNALCERCGACCCCFLSYFPDKPEMVWAHARGIVKVGDYLVVPSMCRYYNAAMDVCTIQESKPKVCKSFVVGSKECQACRKWQEIQQKKVD